MIRKSLIALVLLPTIVLGETESKVALLTDPFNEVLREAALISGARLVGLTAVGPSAGKVSVAAVIPGEWRGDQICLKVVSADGLYESFNAYAVAADWAGGQIDLPYPTKSPAKVAAIPEQLVSGIVLRGDCTQGGQEVAPVFWGKGAFGAIRVLLNTARSDETYLTFPTRPDVMDVVCEPVQTASQNAFDTVCSLPPGLAANLSEAVEAVALSFKNGEMGQEEHMVLRLEAMP